MPEKTKNENKIETDARAEVDRNPGEQALQVVDVAVGAVPEAADAVTKTVDQLRDPEARSQELKSLQNRVRSRKVASRAISTAATWARCSRRASSCSTTVPSPIGRSSTRTWWGVTRKARWSRLPKATSA